MEKQEELEKFLRRNKMLTAFKTELKHDRKLTIKEYIDKSLKTPTIKLIICAFIWPENNFMKWAALHTKWIKYVRENNLEN